MLAAQVQVQVQRVDLGTPSAVAIHDPGRGYVLLLDPAVPDTAITCLLRYLEVRAELHPEQLRISAVPVPPPAVPPQPAAPALEHEPCEGAAAGPRPAAAPLPERWTRRSARSAPQR